MHAYTTEQPVLPGSVNPTQSSIPKVQILDWQSHYSPVLGTTVALDCASNETVQSSLKRVWMKDNREVGTLGRGYVNQNGSLQLANVTWADQGYYTCVIWNYEGVDYKMAFLYVEGESIFMKATDDKSRHKTYVFTVIVYSCSTTAR